MPNPSPLRSCLAVALFFTIGSTAVAAELVMVELKSCVHCRRFNREMAPAYEASELAEKLPLRRVNQRKWPADLAQVDRPPYTPVFILVEDGRELGRFVGYGDPEGFRKRLSGLLDKAGWEGR